MHLKSCGAFHVGQKTSIMEKKWFHDNFALMGVLHRGFPGKMSRQTVSKAQNDGKIHLDATVLKRDLLICHFKWNTNFTSSPVKGSILLSSYLRIFLSCSFSFLPFLFFFLILQLKNNSKEAGVRIHMLHEHTYTNMHICVRTHRHTHLQIKVNKSPAGLSEKYISKTIPLFLSTNFTQRIRYKQTTFNKNK